MIERKILLSIQNEILKNQCLDPSYCIFFPRSSENSLPSKIQYDFDDRRSASMTVQSQTVNGNKNEYI